MPFDLLPAEIQIEIFTYLEGSSLKAVRGVCRAFRDNAEPTLFRYVIASARYQSLGAFQKISLFPIFQKHVREIVFDGSLYDQFLAKNEQAYHTQAAKCPNLESGFRWEKHTRLVTHIDMLLARTDLLPRWKRYVQCYREQEDMKTDGVLMNTISRALDWMPNVFCITYSPHPHHLPVEGKEMRDLLSRGVTTSPATGYTAPDHPFRQLIAALYISQFTGIREFRTEPLKGNPGVEFALSIFDLKEDSDMAAGKHLFQRLEKLVLNMAILGSDDYLLYKNLDKFAELLRSATNLQHFHLNPTHWKSEIGAGPLFARLGLDMMWPKLQTLSLEGVLGDEAEFSGMIKRHKETLTSVKFSKCELFKGVWADIVDEVVFGTSIFPFTLDCVNERGLPYLDYASLSTFERELWKYEGSVKLTDDSDRSFVCAAARTVRGVMLTVLGRNKIWQEVSIRFKEAVARL